MADDIRVRKLTRYFDTLDGDGDGYVSEADLTSAARRYLGVLGVGRDEPRATDLQERSRTLWRDCLAPAGTGERRLPRNELIAHFMRLSPAEAGEPIAAAAEAYFRLCDEDGDGLVGEDEFVTLMTSAARMTEDESETAFDLLDPTGAGELTLEQIQQALREFFFSEDRDAPGNLFFGKY